jgi:hypothetical protein
LADQYRTLSDASSQFATEAFERARMADQLGMQGMDDLQDFWDAQAFQFGEWAEKYAAQAENVYGQLGLNLSNQTLEDYQIHC